MTAVNDFHMPWLLEADDAARRMVRALRRGRTVYRFPWQASLLVRLAGWLPDRRWPASCAITTRTRRASRPGPRRPHPPERHRGSPCPFGRPGYPSGRMIRRPFAAFALLAFAGGACGQSDPTEGTATVGDLPPALVKTLEALGASSGVPDGLGATWEPPRPVAGQPASLSLFAAQTGLTLPVWTSADQGIYATASAGGLFARGGAVFPDTRTPFPNSLWDLQAGADYVQQGADGQSWGVCLGRRVGQRPAVSHGPRGHRLGPGLLAQSDGSGPRLALLRGKCDQRAGRPEHSASRGRLRIPLRRSRRRHRAAVPERHLPADGGARVRPELRGDHRRPSPSKRPRGATPPGCLRRLPGSARTGGRPTGRTDGSNCSSTKNGPRAGSYGHSGTIST